MTLPQILIVDDQYARQLQERMLLLKRTRLREIGSQMDNESVGEVTICSGQKARSAGELVNDVEVVTSEISRLGEDTWSIVLLDMRFDSGTLDETGKPSGMAGDDTFGDILRAAISSRFPNIPIVILTSKRHDELEEQDVAYLSKEGLDADAIVSCLLDRGRLTPAQTRRLLGLNPNITAMSRSSLAIFRQAWHAGRSGDATLILGETGVGKELVARSIHESSPRRAGPFVALNCGAIPAELVESTLFGHEKGAFTGANERRVGKFVEASGGTLFLDEICELPFVSQVKLLRAVQTGEVEPVGGRKPVAVDIQYVSATNRDILDEVRTGRFREDLYYRLASEVINVPPLRDRPEEIPALAEGFLREAVALRGKTGVTFAEGALARLQQFDFPGNVRQLEHQIVRRLAASVSSNQTILERDVAQVLANLPNTRAFSVTWEADETSQPTKPVKDISTKNAFTRLELSGSLKESAHLLTGREIAERIEGALEMTRHVGRARAGTLGDLNPTAAMKLVLGQTVLSTAQAADAIRRFARTTGTVPNDTAFGRALSWATSLRTNRGQK